MKSVVLLFALALANFCNATPIYYMITTGHAGANTTIDSAHEMEWFAPSLTPGCLVTNCTSFPIAEFEPTSDWRLGGGRFEIKVGNSPTDDITLRLWDGNPTGTLGTEAGTLVASATVLRSSLSNSYTPTLFLFATPATLQAGRSYVATLTSPTGTTGSRQYFIKDIDSLRIQEDQQGENVVPEPSAWLLGISGIGLLALSRKRRTL